MSLSSQVPEKNRGTTSVVPLQYSGRKYLLHVQDGNRGNPDWLKDTLLDSDYVTLSMYVDDADIIDENGAVIGQGHSNNIAFHNRESYVKAMQALLAHGISAFGPQVTREIGLG